jgi:hypothetical protein
MTDEPRASEGFDYELDYDAIDFRERPELYRVGKGEQGVLLVRPYKDELLPLWRFRTPAVARVSADAIFARFLDYKAAGDFAGMDMARKFLQMGWTRARRYANHPGGRKYAADRVTELPVTPDAQKAEAARIFYERYVAAREDAEYRRLRADWVKRFG